jgi:hypothetical protein
MTSQRPRPTLARIQELRREYEREMEPEPALQMALAEANHEVIERFNIEHENEV